MCRSQCNGSSITRPPLLVLRILERVRAWGVVVVEVLWTDCPACLLLVLHDEREQAAACLCLCLEPFSIHLLELAAVLSVLPVVDAV
jgi:hypothetical protein